MRWTKDRVLAIVDVVEPDPDHEGRVRQSFFGHKVFVAKDSVEFIERGTPCFLNHYDPNRDCDANICGETYIEVTKIHLRSGKTLLTGREVGEVLHFFFPEAVGPRKPPPSADALFEDSNVSG